MQSSFAVSALEEFAKVIVKHQDACFLDYVNQARGCCISAFD